jgi:PIN domain nuclease of toxin-antitoxin system
VTVLLDTHVWLWWLLGSERLSAGETHSLDRLAASGSVCLSAMSLWEAQMLQAKGRLVLDRSFPSWLREATSPAVIQVLPLDVEVVISLDQLLDGFHGDPADRLIVATGLAHSLTLATHDRMIRGSGVIRIWRSSR